MFMSEWKWKTRKIRTSSPFPVILWIISVCLKKNTDRKKNNNKEERKKKNTDRTQTKLNAPHIKYNVKILPQKLIIRDK